MSVLLYRLGSPLFSKCDFSSQIPETFEEHGIESVKTLGVEYLNVRPVVDSIVYHLYLLL